MVLEEGNSTADPGPRTPVPTGSGRRSAAGVVVLALAALVPVMTPVAGWTQEGPEELLYEEYFDSEAPPGWELEYVPAAESGWWVEDGWLRGRGHRWAVYEPGSWRDGRLELLVRLVPGQEGLHVSVRFSDVGRYFVALHPDRMGLYRQQGFGRGEIIEAIAEQPYPSDDVPHRVGISVYGGRILVMVDGDVAFDWTDPEPLPAGRIAVETLPEGQALVDEVRVFGPGVEPPPGPRDEGPRLDAVEPRQVRRGSELDLQLFGRNFQPGVRIEGAEGVVVRELERHSPEHLRAFVIVVEDAAPGWRELRVIHPDGRSDGLERAFEVVAGDRDDEDRQRDDRQDDDEPPRPPAEWPGWVWLGGTLLLAALSFAGGRLLAARAKGAWTEPARRAWRVEAKGELPEPKKACQWSCKADVEADLSRRWNVTAIELEPLPFKGRTLPSRRLEGPVLAPLNDLGRIANPGHDEGEIRRLLAPCVEALVDQLRSWESQGRTPPAIAVKARLAHPITVRYGLHHCREGKEGLHWSPPLVTWTADLGPPAGEPLGVLRGPTAGEPEGTARIRRELEACLMGLVRGARQRCP